MIVLLHTMAYGGVETLVINWLRTLDRSRIEPTIVCFANPGGTEAPFEEAARNAGLPVRKITWSQRKPVFAAAQELARIVSEVDAHVLHTHNTYAEVVGWLAARKSRVKLMTTLYVWSDFGWKRNVQQWISARLLSHFDLVTSQCETTMAETIRRGVPVSIQKVLISGIPTVETRNREGLRSLLRKQLDCTDANVVLVNVARLYPEKAQDRLIRWFATIAALRPLTRLWIVGVGPLESELKSLVLELGLSERVTFLGFHNDLAPVFASSEIQVHSSRAEGIPLAICEGMAAGMPLVATAVGGIGEIVSHGESGLLVADNDGNAFISSVLKLVDDVPLRVSVGEQARTIARTRYSLERAAEMLASYYEELA